MRFVFLGSPPFAAPVLARLVESSHRALALVTPPDRPRGRGGRGRAASGAGSPLVELAERHGLRVLRPADPHGEDTLAALRALEPQVLMVASYGVILKATLLELAPHGALNVHASLLPRHRGASPIAHAILAGDAVTGVCVQRIVRALDEGDVLLAREHRIGPDATAGELLAELARLGGEAAVEALDRLDAGTATFTPQDGSRATYARKLAKEDGRIDWTTTAVELERFVRAMNPWPAAGARLPDGRELQVLRARVVGDAGGRPGELLETEGRMVVATGRGALELLEVKPAGKRAQPADAFLRGARLARGARLEL